MYITGGLLLCIYSISDKHRNKFENTSFSDYSIYVNLTSSEKIIAVRMKYIYGQQ